MVFTDGQANQRITDAGGILTAAAKTRNGVAISTFGYGTGCNATRVTLKLADGVGSSPSRSSSRPGRRR